MSRSLHSLRASLIQTVPHPGDTPSAVDPPTLRDLSVKFVISLRLLQMCTSVALSISQQFCLGSFTASTFGCHLSLSGFGSALATVFCVVEPP